jgi:hypothetical protein
MRFAWLHSAPEWLGVVPRKAITKRKLRLPSWWMALAPGRPAGFWVRVERERLAAGVSRADHSAISYIVNRLAHVRPDHNKGVPHHGRK